jgi:hypothetical protein
MRASIVSNSASGVKPIQRFFALESLQPIEQGHHPFGAESRRQQQELLKQLRPVEGQLPGSRECVRLPACESPRVSF